MALLKLGKIPYNEIEIDIYKDEARTPEFKKNINKFATVPALMHQDEFFGESNAIMVYLCEAFPEELSNYYGSNLIEKTRINEYLSWYQSSFRPNMLAILMMRWRYAILLK